MTGSIAILLAVVFVVWSCMLVTMVAVMIHDGNDGNHCDDGDDGNGGDDDDRSRDACCLSLSLSLLNVTIPLSTRMCKMHQWMQRCRMALAQD